MYIIKIPNKNKNGLHRTLPAAAPHPSTYFYWIKTIPVFVKPFIRPFCTILAANSTQSRAGLDYSGP